MLHLKELRTQKGLTQSELSKALNVSASSIGMYEQGRREPDNDTLKKIANFFNVTTDYLLGLSDQPHGEPFAGQSGKNSIDSANQPPAPAGQSGKQSLGSAEGEMEECVQGFEQLGGGWQDMALEDDDDSPINAESRKLLCDYWQLDDKARETIKNMIEISLNRRG